MLQQLINHSTDIKKLVEEGYEIEIIGGQFLIAHHIPYVTASHTIKYGKLVCALTLSSPSRTGTPPDHTAYFTGETPCEANGLPLTAIINNSQMQVLSHAITINHYFSSKPAAGNYSDYYEKVRTYSQILAAQAQVIDATVTARPNRFKTATHA